MNRSALIAAALVAVAGSCSAQKLACTDASNKHLWVKKLLVDFQAKSVTLTLAQPPSPRIATIVDASESQFGKPVIAFNLPPLEGGPPVTNVFKLFHTGAEWRLVDAGLLEVNGRLALRALGDSVAFNCKGSG